MASELAEDVFTDLGAFPYETDAGLGTKANIGLLVLATDQTLEREFQVLTNQPGLAVYHSRLENDLEVTPETLIKMRDRLPGTARLLPPGVEFDVVAYGCTSGAMVIGEEVVAAQVRSALPGVRVTDPVSALLAAFAHLGVSRIGLLTPYLPVVNRGLRERLLARGLEVPVMGSFHESDDFKVARTTTDSVLKALIEIGRRPECEAVFVSCTNLRVVEILAEAEDAIGKPVTSSNHALAWHALTLAGLPTERPGCGQLFAAR